MSHFTKINVEVRDMAALKAACTELGFPVEENTTARGYDGNVLKGEYVIRLQGPYDVALNRQPNGAYGLEADLWRGHVEKELGAGFGRLKQVYGVHKTSMEARRRGMMVRRCSGKNGSIRLTLCPI